jgi:hypothetical protein
MTNKLKVHKQEKIIISIVYCLSIYFDDHARYTDGLLCVHVQ